MDSSTVIRRCSQVQCEREAAIVGDLQWDVGRRRARIFQGHRVFFLTVFLGEC